MSEKTSLSGQLANSDFSIKMLKIMLPMISAHAKSHIENLNNYRSSSFDDEGDAKEKHLKSIWKYFNRIRRIVSDLELVLIFLRIKDRKNIAKNYPEIDDHEAYFIYHFENYIIRVNTFTDVIGKLGNELYETRLDKVNGYSFKEELKKHDAEKASIVEKLLVKTKEVKDRRHEKIHEGKTDINYLEGVIFWDNIEKLLKEEIDPILKDYSNKDLSIAVDEIETEIREIITITNEFLSCSLPQLETIINR
jgi:hypothetical protein